jgi:GDPmannose 4,6-dehydratase
MKTALITGITGQDGSYLAEFLLAKGYKVVGVKRRTSLINTGRVDEFYENTNFILEYGNLHDAGCFWRLLMKHIPDEIYNLAAQSHVRVSFEVPEETVDSVVMGTLRLMNAYKQVCPNARFYQASSSEMYGDNPAVPFNEGSLMTPASPYACGKLFAHNLVRNYREAYNLHASSGILFNHESPKRGETFVTRKITMAAARIKLGLQKELRLGNLDAKRDWGFAGDYVEAMWLMLQQEKADDYVIATGSAHSVRDFLNCVFEYAELGDPDQYVRIDARYLRPHEVPYLLGDASKAKKQLDWKPRVSFKELAQMMYDADLEEARQHV